MTTLLLFDIDGTLLRGATSAHQQALHRALRAVHGIDPAAERGLVDPAGRTDGEIARLILLGAGVSAARIDERAADVRTQCSRIYAELTRDLDLGEFVIPGIPELLDRLAARADVRLALVTGNYEAVARTKLRRAGIAGPFAGCPGGFGSDSEDRAALPGIARHRAGQTGRPWPRKSAIVIGDTPRDIACARADGLRCVAVSTGAFHAADLTGADARAADPRELAAVLAPLLAG